jgi:hypothetical protein
VVVSFGGWSGDKLGEKCSSASALAGAYQKVINAYHLKAIDIDIENTEFGSSTVRQSRRRDVGQPEGEEHGVVAPRRLPGEHQG